MVKIQIIEEEQERHCLSQDLARVLARNESSSLFDTEVRCAGSDKDNGPLHAHSLIITARCPLLACMLTDAKDPSHKVRSM